MQSDEIFEHVLRETDVTLFPHQVSAIQWMQRTERRTRMVSEQPHGGILAHAMGLGKTITTLSLMLVQGIGCTIVVCPKSVINQWRDEAVRILKLAPEQVVLYHGSLREAELFRACQRGGPRVVLTTFDIVRLDTRAKPVPHDNAATKRVVKGVADPHDRGLQPFQPKASEFESRPDVDLPVVAPSGSTSCGTSRVSLLHSEHWDRIILDEAHRICEQSSKTARAIRTLRARNRWCITGTPFKNGISDLVALSKFLLVPPYCNSTWWRCHSHNKHKISEWRNMFMNIQDKSVLALSSISYNVLVIPPSAAEEQITSHVNNMFNQHIQNELSTSEKMASGIDLARNPSVSDLLSRDVAVIDIDIDIDNSGSDIGIRSGGGGGDTRKLKRKVGGIEPIPLCNRQEYELLKIMRLRQAANHSLLLTNTTSAMLYLLTTPELGSGQPVCEAKPGTGETARKSQCHGCGSRIDRLSLKRAREHDLRQVKRSSLTRTPSLSVTKSVSSPSPALRDSNHSLKHRCNHVLCNSCATNTIMCPVCIASSMYTVKKNTGDVLAVWRHSSKTLALYNYLTAVFESDADAKVVLFSQWTTCLDLLGAMLQFMGIEFGRFDGRVNSIDERADIILKFKTTRRCQVLLTSLGAGGEGLNLTFANHVVLMEPYWNIAVEQQAIDRLHRIGQTRTTCVLRLYTKNSIEHWVQDIQMKKNKELKRLLSEDEVVVTGDGKCLDFLNDVISASKSVHNCLDAIRRLEQDSDTGVQYSVQQSGANVGCEDKTESSESEAHTKNTSQDLINKNSGGSTVLTQQVKSAGSDVVTASSRRTSAPRQDAHARKKLGGETCQSGVGVPNLKVPLRGFSNGAEQRQALISRLPYGKNRFKIDSTPPPVTRQRSTTLSGVGTPQHVFLPQSGSPVACEPTPVKTCFSVDGLADKCGHATKVDATGTSNRPNYTKQKDRHDELLSDESALGTAVLTASHVAACGKKQMHGLSQFLLGS